MSNKANLLAYLIGWAGYNRGDKARPDTRNLLREMLKLGILSDAEADKVLLLFYESGGPRPE